MAYMDIFCRVQHERICDMSGSFYNYLLYNQDNNTTYNGYTVNLDRRIRQHNGILKGGAKATHRSKSWKYLAVVSCDTFTKHTALSFEWHVRYPSCKKPRPTEFAGPLGRLKSLPLVFSHRKFVDMEFSLWISPRFHDILVNVCNISFPENVNIVTGDVPPFIDIPVPFPIKENNENNENSEKKESS